MLTPEYPAAVVAGNVETSQAVTNCLFGALGALAAAQGTMNNLNFGNARYQYYETICSGSPAGPGFNGTDAVHTHMTNTRLTDPEILEFRYPVVLEDFHIRKGSGGAGKWHAGDGIRRTIRFLEKMECTILSGHRRVRPFGLAGGEAGQVGENCGAAQGRPHRKAARLRRDRDRCRRGHHHPDADRGGIWAAGLAATERAQPATRQQTCPRLDLDQIPAAAATVACPNVSPSPRGPPCVAAQSAIGECPEHPFGAGAAGAAATDVQPHRHPCGGLAPRAVQPTGAHAGKRFLIDPTDLPFVLVLTPLPERPLLTAHRRHERPAHAAAIAGTFFNLLDMIDGSLDGDALFFSRDLQVSGDTEAVVALRNALDDFEGSALDSVVGELRAAVGAGGARLVGGALDTGTKMNAISTPGAGLPGRNAGRAAGRRRCRRRRGLLRLRERNQCAQLSRA